MASEPGDAWMTVRSWCDMTGEALPEGHSLDEVVHATGDDCHFAATCHPLCPTVPKLIVDSVLKLVAETKRL